MLCPCPGDSSGAHGQEPLDHLIAFAQRIEERVGKAGDPVPHVLVGRGVHDQRETCDPRAPNCSDEEQGEPCGEHYARYKKGDDAGCGEIRLLVDQQKASAHQDEDPDQREGGLRPVGLVPVYALPLPQPHVDPIGIIRVEPCQIYSQTGLDDLTRHYGDDLKVYPSGGVVDRLAQRGVDQAQKDYAYRKDELGKGPYDPVIEVGSHDEHEPAQSHPLGVLGQIVPGIAELAQGIVKARAEDHYESEDRKSGRQDHYPQVSVLFFEF